MTDRCTQYALDVVAGVIIAGEYVRLACQRHLDDLEKAKAAPYKYYFDVEKSEEIINFAEELTIAEGDEQENVTAYPFQCFILGSLNGWRTKEKGHRRFRTSYVQLGRQNGKSFINGILACYYGNFDGYKYGKIFCTATKQDQANIVFDEIVKFINSDEDLSEWFKVHEHNHTIDCLCTHSEIKALSGDTKSLDGHRAYLGIVDEYHAHKTNQMYKLLEGGIKKLKSALISVITTAGFDLKSPCYKLYEYCCNLLKGVFENDSQFVYIAQLDTADDLYKKENWIKANPILEYDEDALENLVPVANTARDMGGEDLRDFLVNCSRYHISTFIFAFVHPLFTPEITLISPRFHSHFTPILSFSIAFAPNNLIERRSVIDLHHFFGEFFPHPVSLTISSYDLPLIYTASSASYLYPSPAASASSFSDDNPL